MNEIYVGAVTEFYEAEEIVSSGEVYRTSPQDIEMTNSIDMLRKHLCRYAQKDVRPSKSNELPRDNGGADYTPRDLDDFFNEG